MSEIIILDYGLGNLRSIGNMFRKAGTPARISADPDDVATASKLVLPGVGAFDTGVNLLNQSGLRAPLEHAVVEQRTPILGICLGMQLFGRRSAEGSATGLGWLAAETRRFEGSSLKVPHMGWNHVRPTRESTLFPDHESEQRFYFLHSYYMACDLAEDVVGSTAYGIEFASAVQRDHVYGVQFHPEKSHRFGLQLLTYFAEKA